MRRAVGLGAVGEPGALLLALAAFLAVSLLGCEGAPPGARPAADGPAEVAAPEDPTQDDPEPEPAEPPPALTHYMGREIAVTMHWQGAEWLWRESRESEEGTSRLLAALDVRPGQVVCDFGSGSGYLTLPLAGRAGADGRVWASDIQPEMLRMLAERAEEAGVENVTSVLSLPWDPRLPEATFDLVLMVDVYHEVSHPEQVLAGVRRSLKSGGRLVLVEFRGEDPDVPIKPLHKMTKEQVVLELAANGFELVWQYDELPWQHVLGFGSAP